VQIVERCNAAIPPPRPMEFEIIESRQLAARWCVAESWVRSHVRANTPDMIPHVRLGSRVRFEWGSEALNEWFDRHRHGYNLPQKQEVPEGPVNQEVRELACPVQRLEPEPSRGARLARAVYGPRAA